MGGLDYQLHAWLTEPDERRFERAFGAYFLVAFPAVVRHLAQLSHWDAAQLEDLAQEALLKFFDKVGRGRRDAAQAVASALARVRPLRLGTVHERQVALWAAKVAAFKEAAMGFRPPATGESNSAGWKAVVRELADRVLHLQGQGCQILRDVDLTLRLGSGGKDCGGVTEPNDVLRVDSTQLRDCAQTFAAKMTAGTATAIAAEHQIPGVRGFCADVYTVIEGLPRLRVPTNSFLFEIASSTYLDESKKRRRQKRGGTAVAVPVDYIRDTHPPALLEAMPLDSDRQVAGTEDINDSPAAPIHVVDPAPLSVPASDPAQRCESQDFFEKFYLYLREPLDNAAREYEAARARGPVPAEAQRRRVDSLTNKFARMMSVLSLLGEGYSQERTAETLGLSRNQVKYIIEGAQRAYAEFAAASIGSAPRTPERDLHVR